MIYDYYLSSILFDEIQSFDTWEKESQERLQDKTKNKYGLWLEEIFMVPLGKSKNKFLTKQKEKNYNKFYPVNSDLQYLPQNSVFIQISFTLKKPYTSKDEGEFYIIEETRSFAWRNKKELIKYLKKQHNIEISENDISIERNKISFENSVIEREESLACLKINGKIREFFIVKKEDSDLISYNCRVLENPLVRDKLTRLPMVKPSTWKGHLRFAAEKIDWEKEEKERIIKRLFGSEPGEKENPLKGRLYFFPTFFEDGAYRDVITPLKRDTRTPARGPINLEVMKPGKNGDFYLLYVPYPKGKDFKEEDIDEDLKFLAEALKLMFYTYGFSAKKTSGFGIIEEKLSKGEALIKSSEDRQKIIFSTLEDLKNRIDELRVKQ